MLPPICADHSYMLVVNQAVKDGTLPRNKIALQSPDGKITQLENPSEPVRYNMFFPRLFLLAYS